MFDPNDPPTSYRKFKKSILTTIEGAEVGVDEDYDLALFMVNRDNDGDIVGTQDFIEELADEAEHDIELEDEMIPQAFLIHQVFPQKIKNFNAKFFAIVFQGTHEDEDGEESDVLVCLVGSGPTAQMMVGDIDLYRAFIYEEEGEVGVDMWEPIPFGMFGDLVIQYRRAICPQG